MISRLFSSFVQTREFLRDRSRPSRAARQSSSDSEKWYWDSLHSNIAIENRAFIVDLPIENGDVP